MQKITLFAVLALASCQSTPATYLQTGGADTTRLTVARETSTVTPELWIETRTARGLHAGLGARAQLRGYLFEPFAVVGVSGALHVSGDRPYHGGADDYARAGFKSFRETLQGYAGIGVQARLSETQTMRVDWQASEDETWRALIGLGWSF